MWGTVATALSSITGILRSCERRRTPVSFSSEVKQELAAIQDERPCCRAAEAYGMAEFGHAFSERGVSLQTENAFVVRLYAGLLGEVCQTPLVVTEGKGLYTAAAADREARLRILKRFGHTPTDVGVRLNRANLECDQCPAAFVRGAFLSCGTVTNPEMDYHLEFSVPFLNLSRDLTTLLTELGLAAKWTHRGGGYVVYFKESESIEDCLTLMGATTAALKLMGVKMIKDIRNNANRVTNCESANIDKTVAASAQQSEAVRKIERTVGLNALPEELREVARLRLENPEFSLRELGEALENPMTRSGVNHRLRRIMRFADSL